MLEPNFSENFCRVSDRLSTRFGIYPLQVAYQLLVFTIKSINPSTSTKVWVTCGNLFKVTGNALNIEYYFWWRDCCFGLLIHDDAVFHFMISISDEYKYK